MSYFFTLLNRCLSKIEYKYKIANKLFCHFQSRLNIYYKHTCFCKGGLSTIWWIWMFGVMCVQSVCPAPLAWSVIRCVSVQRETNCATQCLENVTVPPDSQDQSVTMVRDAFVIYSNILGLFHEYDFCYTVLDCDWLGDLHIFVS